VTPRGGGVKCVDEVVTYAPATDSLISLHFFRNLVPNFKRVWMAKQNEFPGGVWFGHGNGIAMEIK
jgi:hypothetical protein